MWRRIVVLVLIVVAAGLWAWMRPGRLGDGIETRQPGSAGGSAVAASPRAGAAVTPPVALVQAEEAVLPAAVLERAEGPMAVQLVRRAGGRREPIRIEEQQGRRREMAGDHLLITPRAGIDRAQLAAAVARTGAHLRRQVGRTRSWLAAFPVASHEDLPRQRLALAAQPEIAAVEDDAVLRALVEPGDARFGEQWSLRNTGQEGGTVGADIDADGAWSVTTGDARVLVGVIDSGIDFSHPDLAAARWSNPGETGTDGDGRDRRSNGVDDDGNGYIDDWRGWDFVADDNDPADENGHGTHCAGVIGARGDAIGIAGIAWRTSLVGLRFLDAGGSGLTSDAVAAVDYATRIGCALTSNSWGGSASSAVLRDAILANPAPFVAAAGNSATDNDATPQYPASYDCPTIIAVSATTRTDALAGFSCFGAASVDLGAPGDSILSSVPGGWQVKSGTSMAAPHVTGVLALMRAAAPERDAASLKAAVLAATDPIAALRGRCVSGGRLNAARALDAVAGVMVVVEAQAQAEEGDGDGVFEPGEAVAIRLTLRSSGALAAPGVTGTLVLDGATDTVEAATVIWGDIAAGTSLAAPQPFRVRLAATTAARLVSGTITLSEAGGRTWPCPVSFPAAAGGLLRVRVQDTAGTALVGATVRWDGLATGAAPSTTQAVAGWPNCLRQLPTGTYQVSASAAGYAPAGPLTVAVPVMGLTPVLTLTRPRMAVSPSSLALAVPAGGATSASLRIDNPGDSPLDVTAEVVGQPAMTATGLWHRSTRRTANGGLAWWYGREADGSYGGATASGTLTSAPFALSFPILSFSTWRSVEADPARDRLLVEASGDGGQTWATLATVTGTTTAWQPQSAYLFAFRPGQLVQVRFTAQVRDDQPRTGEGWFVDAIQSGYGATIDPWLEITASARVPAGGSVLLPVLAGLDTGFNSRTATVRLTGSDPLLPSLDIPVTLSRILLPSLDLAGISVSEVAGDGDLALEPGETGGVVAQLRNGGEAVARGLSVTLATTSPWATVTRGSATCADIAVGWSASTGRLDFAVAAGCPVGTAIPLTFTAQDDGGRTWSMSATAAVTRRCRLNGTVTRAADGAPLAGVEVRRSGPSAGSVHTWVAGGYAMSGLDPGIYTISFIEPGYAIQERTLDLRDDAVQDAALAVSAFTPSTANVYLNPLPGGSASAAFFATASGPVAVAWCATATPDWLTVAPIDGTASPGTTTAFILLAAPPAGQAPGRYAGRCVITNRSAGDAVERVEVAIDVGTPPRAFPTTAATVEEQPVTFTLLADDPGGDPLTAAIVGSSYGTLTLAGRVCTYTPRANWNGTENLRFTVSDGVFTSAQAALTITVAAVDDGISVADLSLAVRPGVEASLYLSDADPDSAETWSIRVPPAAGVATLAGTRLTYRSPPYLSGSDRLELEVVSASGSATCALAVTIAEPPTTGSLAVQARCNDPRLITLPGTAGSGGTLSSRILGAPRYGTLTSASGVARGWVYQPQRDFTGDDAFTFEITESGSPSLPASAAITVAPAPAVAGKLVASTGAPGDRFGAAVALDGDLAVVGAPLAAPNGKAYLFQRQADGRWLQVFTLIPAQAGLERFGTAVALQGRFLVVAGGLRGGEAAAVVYQGLGASWMPTATITTGSASSATVRERCVSLALDGGLLALGTPYAGTGAVSLYRFGDSGWTSVARLAGPPEQIDFGSSVSLSGERVLVGAPYGWSPWYGGATVWAGPTWTCEASLNPAVVGGMGGKAVALRGDTAVVAVPGYSNSAGSLEVWQRMAGAWSWTHNLVNPGWDDSASYDQLGSALAWDGAQLLASAPYLWQPDVGAAGAVAHLRLSDGGRLSQGSWWRAGDAAHGDWAASALAVQGKRRLIGVEMDDANGRDSGAAYLFDQDDPPRVAVAATATTAEDTALTIPATTSDPDGDATTLVVVVPPAHGSATVVGSTVVYLPAADWSGGDAIVLAAHDGAQPGASATVAVTVTPVNDAPTLRAAALATDEDAALVFLPEAGDADGDALIFAVQQAPAHGSLSIIGAQVRYQPAADWNGSDAFSLVASDGLVTSALAVFTVTVRPVDDAPVLADASAATDEDQPVTVHFAVADADGGDPLTLALASPPAHGLCRIEGLSVVYTPAADWNGSDTFAVMALSRALTSLPATASVTVNPVDDPAQPATGAWTVDEDATLTIAPTLTDIDGGPACELAVVVAPAHGSARVEGQTVVYQPAADWHGEDVLLIVAGIGDRWSAPATQAVTVRAVDDAPVVSATSAVTAEDTAVAVAVTVGDVDGGEPPTLALASPPANGLCRIEGLSVVYTPAADWNGSDTFAVVALSGALTSAPATVAVTVLPVDDPAQPATGAWTVDEDTSLTITPILVDLDGGPAPILALVAPAHGIARVDGLSVVYQPAADWHGEDVLLISACIEGRWSAQAIQTITVRAVDDAPVLPPTRVVTDEDVAVSVTIPVIDVDGGADPALRLAAAPAHGDCRIDGLVVTYQPHPDWHGDDAFTLVAEVGGRRSSPAPVAVVVRAVDDPPRIDPLADLTATAGATVRVVCRIGDIDDDLASLVMDAQLELGGARAASAVAVRWEGLGAQRTLVADLPAGLTGSALATVGVTDPAGRRSATSFRLTVLPPEPVAQPVLPPASSPAASAGGGGGGGGCGLGGLGIAILAVGAAMAGRRRRR